MTQAKTIHGNKNKENLKQNTNNQSKEGESKITENEFKKRKEEKKTSKIEK